MHCSGTIARRRTPSLLLLAAALALAGCRKEECLLPEACCGSCDDPAVGRVSCSGCGAEEVPAYLCPKRSACALDYYVGEGPALCCEGSCESAIAYETSGAPLCRAADAYLHECAVESDCFQAHRARALGTVYLPFREESSGSGMPLYALWGADDLSGDESLWAVGAQGRVLRREAGIWRAEEVASSETLTAIWGSGGEDIWIGGTNGTLLNNKGEGWQRVELPTPMTVTGIWGRSASEIWIVGASGTIMRFDGTSWQAEQSSTEAHISAIHGAGDEVVAVGEAGLVLRRVGGLWQREVAVGSDDSLTSVFVDGLDGRIWACGIGGALLERSAEGRWRSVEVPFRATLTSVWRDGQGRLWVVGQGGTIWRGVNDGPLEVVSYFSAAGPADLLALFGGPSALFVSGERGTVLRYDWER